jgi:transcriptional regulator with XRE-family HTH domain
MSHLQNYLRSNRKRLALSQADVAFLLGNQSSAKICRYERFVREPNLKTALALAVIFKKPIEELFAGMYRTVEREISARAKALSYRLEQKKPSPQTRRRRETLTNLAPTSTDKSHNPS